jgi:hypothetical protein
MKNFLLISLIALCTLSTTSVVQAQKDTPSAATKPAVEHDASFGEAGSIRIFNKSKKLIASVRVNKGVKTIFVNEELLRQGTPQAIKTLQTKDYADFKNLLTKRITAISNGENPGSVDTWGWVCARSCRMHGCEDYDWVWPSFN